MAFVPFLNCARLEVQYNGSSANMMNVFHYLGDFDPPEDMLQDMVENMITVWDTSWVPCLSSTVRLTGIKATDLSAEDAPTYAQYFASGHVGTMTGDAMPTAVAAVVTWRTANRGRSARGRTYFGGISESHNNGNILATELTTRLATLAGDLMALATYTGPVQLCVASRFHNGIERVQGVTYPITSYEVRPNPHTQRRRTFNIGW